VNCFSDIRQRASLMRRDPERAAIPFVPEPNRTLVAPAPESGSESLWGGGSFSPCPRSNMARRLMGTKRFHKSRDERKRVEMRFAHLKTHHGFERMRLRGLSGVRDEFHLAAIAQNLKTMALRLLGTPTGGTCASNA
jgi:hypothetical protein